MSKPANARPVKRHRAPARKTPKPGDQVAELVGRLVEKRKHLTEQPLEEVLAELGRTVGHYTIYTGPTYDGIPTYGPDGEIEMPPIDGWTYRVEYRLRLSGRPGFGCYGVWRDTLKEAAIESLLAGLGWTGAFREGGAG